MLPFSHIDRSGNKIFGLVDVPRELPCYGTWRRGELSDKDIYEEFIQDTKKLNNGELVRVSIIRKPAIPDEILEGFTAIKGWFEHKE